MTTRLSSVQRSHGRSEGLFCASVVLIDLLVPVLQCYGAYLDGHAGTAAAERRAEDLLSGGALARACAIPTVYAALAVAMLLEVLIGRTTAAPGLEAPVEKALGHLAALAKRLPIARPMSLMWGAWWQHLQGNTNEAILQLNQVPPHPPPPAPRPCANPPPPPVPRPYLPILPTRRYWRSS